MEEFEKQGGLVETDDFECRTNHIYLDGNYEAVSKFLQLSRQTYTRRSESCNGVLLEMKKEERYRHQTLIVASTKYEFYQWKRALYNVQCINTARDDIKDDSEIVLMTKKLTHLLTEERADEDVLYYRVICPESFLVHATETCKAVFTYTMYDRYKYVRRPLLSLTISKCQKPDVTYHKYVKDNVADKDMYYCSICLSDVTTIQVFACSHVACTLCYARLIADADTCHMCRAPLVATETRSTMTRVRETVKLALAPLARGCPVFIFGQDDSPSFEKQNQKFQNGNRSVPYVNAFIDTRWPTAMFYMPCDAVIFIDALPETFPYCLLSSAGIDIHVFYSDDSVQKQYQDFFEQIDYQDEKSSLD
jgi:hypothetical protein